MKCPDLGLPGTSENHSESSKTSQNSFVSSVRCEPPLQNAVPPLSSARRWWGHRRFVSVPEDRTVRLPRLILSRGIPPPLQNAAPPHTSDPDWWGRRHFVLDSEDRTVRPGHRLLLTSRVITSSTVVFPQPPTALCRLRWRTGRR